MKKYYFLSDQELCDLTSRKKSMRGLKLKYLEIKKRAIRVFYSPAVEKEFPEVEL